MANSVGQIGLDLTINNAKFKKQLKEISNSAKKASTDLSGSFNGITNLAKKAAVALGGAFAVGKLVSFGKECLELGSNLAEVQNVVDVSFPAMSKQVDNFAKEAKKSFGLSETMAKRFTGTFGAMSKTFGFSEKQAYDMSTTLTGLAGDVASFYNMTQDEAYTKLKSVFTGETENLKDLGIVMTQTALDQYALNNGFGKTTQKMTEQEKVMLRYQFVTSQLSGAAGDFVRTQDSWANQTRILSLQMDSLKASIGQGLINAFTPAIKQINAFIGKLQVAGEAFKNFTAMIFGEAGGSSGAGSVGTEVADAMASADTSSSAISDNLASAKKQAKEMSKQLMGFDQINKLSDDNDSDSDSSSNMGNLGSSSMIDTINSSLDDTEKKLSGIKNVFDTVAKSFMKGFKLGIGDLSVLDSIKTSIENIGGSLKDIFTDKNVIKSAKDLGISIVENLGKVTGSVASIGFTIADNLLGGVSNYLAQNTSKIQDYLVSMFQIGSRYSEIIGNFSIVVADIFSVFRSDSAKQITTDLIAIFSNSFMGITELASKFSVDMIDMILTPITQNGDKIKETINNTLTPVSEIVSTVSNTISKFFDDLNIAYDEHVSPMFQSFKDGWTEIVGNLLDKYNEYIAPVLDNLSNKFQEVWVGHIEPVFNHFIGIVGKVADSIKEIWEKTVQPFIMWLIDTLGPVLAPVIEKFGGFFIDLLGVIGDVIDDLLTAFGGLIDFITGIFTGDWKKAWNGIRTLFEGVVNAIKDFFQGKLNAIKELLSPVTGWFKNTFEGAWSNIKNAFSSVGSFFSGVWNNIKNAFSNVKTWFKDIFSTAWNNVKYAFSSAGNFFRSVWSNIKNAFGNISGWFKDQFTRAWEAVKNVFSSGGKVFSGIKDGILSGLKSVINTLIKGINKVIKIPFDGINNALGRLKKVDILGAKPFGWLPSVGVPQIPMLAQGGYVKPNTPQLAMIGDNRHQGEVVAPEDKLLEMAMKAASMVGGNNNNDEIIDLLKQLINIVLSKDNNVYLDGKSITKNVVKNINKETISRGKNPILI